MIFAFPRNGGFKSGSSIKNTFGVNVTFFLEEVYDGTHWISYLRLKVRSPWLPLGQAVHCCPANTCRLLVPRLGLR